MLWLGGPGLLRRITLRSAWHQSRLEIVSQRRALLRPINATEQGPQFLFINGHLRKPIIGLYAGLTY